MSDFTYAKNIPVDGVLHHSCITREGDVFKIYLGWELIE